MYVKRNICSIFCPHANVNLRGWLLLKIVSQLSSSDTWVTYERMAKNIQNCEVSFRLGHFLNIDVKNVHLHNRITSDWALELHTDL